MLIYYAYILEYILKGYQIKKIVLQNNNLFSMVTVIQLWCIKNIF